MVLEGHNDFGICRPANPVRYCSGTLESISKLKTISGMKGGGFN